MKTVADGLAGGRGLSIGLLIVPIPHFSLSSICYRERNRNKIKYKRAERQTVAAHEHNVIMKLKTSPQT